MLRCFTLMNFCYLFRLISFNEFQAFEGRLTIPDALYRTAFQLFDTNGNGSVSYDEFKEIISKTTLHQQIPFPLDASDFVKLYFGKERERSVSYVEFSQFLHDFHDEYAMVGFKAKDKTGQVRIYFCTVFAWVWKSTLSLS